MLGLARPSTALHPPDLSGQAILDMVDEGTFAFNAAVEISYLPEEHQKILLEAMDYAQASPSLSQARKIRAFSASGKLDSNVVEAILSEEKPLERKVTLRNDKLKNTFRPLTRRFRWKRS